MIRRPMPRHLKTWARGRRRCRFPSSRWNRRRRCRRRLTAHQTPAVPTHTTSATINADKPAKPDAPHWVWNFRDIAAAAEQAKPVDEPPSSAELGSPSVPEVLPGDQTTDAETPQDLGTRQAPVPVPEQPVEQAATVSPSAHIAPTPDVPKPTTSGTINADEPDKLAARYRSWNFRDIAAAAEQAKPVDEPPSSAELGSPSVPEVLPGDQTTDGETPQDLGTKQAPVPAPEQPVEQAVTASPSAHIAPTLAVPTHTASATVNADRPGKLDARYRPWTLQRCRARCRRRLHGRDDRRCRQTWPSRRTVSALDP